MHFFVMIICALVVTNSAWAVDVLCSAHDESTRQDVWLKRFTKNDGHSVYVPECNMRVSFKLDNDKIVLMTLDENRGTGAWFSDPNGKDKVRMSFLTGAGGRNMQSYRYECQVLR